ncbi:hypothetical protein B0A48_07168 [Cryoendolithus antarcticus]|uniref:Uncharacterized protein n=1 Tax=Cryoendolithus antarcticus TaxID=1507870 RepID=A0A1V8T888_9PEZI|nr:hypothetical protein B0A48_07168 [Cryoendolithus antarcticus]
MSAAEHVAIVHQAAHRIRIRHSEGNGRYRHRFHDSRLETSDKLYRRALESAQAAIIEDQTETWASNDFAGPLTVRRGRMTPHVIAMGRLLRSHHLALGLHPLTLDERADWDHAVEMIWDALRAMRVDRWSGEFTDFYPEVRRRVNIAAAEFTARVTLGDPRGELLWARWLDITEAGLEYAGPPSWRACGHMTIMLITYLGRQCALQTRRDGEN